MKMKAAAPPPKPDDEGDDDKAPDSESGDNSAALSECAEACRSASAACASAVEALDKAADELEGGTDSVSTLTAAETASTAASAALGDVSGKCSALRGVEAAPGDDKPAAAAPPPPPAPGAPKAMASVAERIETARFAAFGKAAMLATGQTTTEAALAFLAPRLKLAEAALASLGEKDPVRAKGVLGARLQRATDADKLEQSLAATAVVTDAAAREKLWEGAVEDGRVKIVQAFTREDAGPNKTPVRAYAAWAKAQNAAYPELAAFEGWIASLPKGAHKSEAVAPSTLLADEADKRPAPFMSQKDMLRMRAAGLDPAVVAAVARQQMRGATFATDEEQGV